MIRMTVFGDPIDTGAITQNVDTTQEIAHFLLENDGDSLTFTCPLSPDDVVWGLGETMGRVNKRGGRYISFNTDTADHSDSNPSLYASHNFLIVDGEAPFGVFFDTPARTIFEIDYRGSGQIRVVCQTQDLRLYQLEGESAYAIAKAFNRAIGRAYLPPLWAFGYGQSRFGYASAEDFREVARMHRENRVPLDWICMDIDYMDRFIDFTFDKKRIPDPAGLVKDMAEQNIRLVPIVDAGIKVEPGDPVYEEGVKGGYFCRNREGGFFQAGVWPGLTHFPDFLNEKAREWFGNQYKFYTDLGFEGFWNDMNEPAIFYSEYDKGPKKLKMFLGMLFPARMEQTRRTNLLRDYKSFFHQVRGKRLRHYDVHNLFGAMMTRSSSEGLARLLPHRFLLFARSSYIGAGRYGGVWTGDNSSKWEHLMLNLRHMPSLNMCGFLYSGADTGGFMGNCTRELLLRWLAVSVFTPLMRNHCGKFLRDQEVYRFGDVEAFRGIIALRYRLLPYLYSEYMKAALTGDLFIRPLGFEYPEAKEIEDQLLVGESIMMAPIVREGQTRRRVYLPENMTCVRWDGKNFTCTPMEKGDREITAELHEVVFFIRKGCLVPIGRELQSTAEADFNDLTLLGDGESYALYTDDGLCRDCSMENVKLLKR
jgi:alpha-glucosidase